MIATNSIVSNTWIRQVELEFKGDKHESHTHTFDHQHLLTSGSVLVTVDGKSVQYDAPAMIFIEKGKYHELEAVTNTAVGYCIHPIRDGGRVEDIIPEDMDPLKKWDLSTDMYYDPKAGEASKFIESPAKPWDNKDNHA